MESKDPENDGSLKGGSRMFFIGIIIYFVISGAIGASWYFNAETCEDTAFVTYRWTWAAILLFLILASMLFSDVFGTLGGPIFGKVGKLIGALFQSLADFFNTMADVLEEGSDPLGQNPVPKRSGAAVFAIYVNHAAFMWFFLYILFEAHKERTLECDKPLRTFLYVFSGIGAAFTFFHFLFEMFAGIKTREKIAKKKHVLMGALAILCIVWGIAGFTWVQTAKTCKEDGNAVNTYRISYLLSLCFLVFCCLGALFGCMGVLDFLCSGKMRFVVVISTGEEDEEEERP